MAEPVAGVSVRCGELRRLLSVLPATWRLDKDVDRPLVLKWLLITKRASGDGVAGYRDVAAEKVPDLAVGCGELGGLGRVRPGAPGWSHEDVHGARNPDDASGSADDRVPR